MKVFHETWQDGVYRILGNLDAASICHGDLQFGDELSWKVLDVYLLVRRCRLTD